MRVDRSQIFNLSALRPGSAFTFLKPEVESGPRGTISGWVIGDGPYGGILVKLGSSGKARVDEWSRYTFVMPLTTSAVRV